MFNINAPEFLVILVVALVVIGPQRLPEYAETLARWVRQLRDMAMSARESVRAELGPEFDDIDWTKYDPRQYDPRKIVRDALLEPFPERSREPDSNDEPEPADQPKPAGAHVAFVDDDASSVHDPSVDGWTEPELHGSRNEPGAVEDTTASTALPPFDIDAT